MVMINLAIGKLVHPLYNQGVTDTTMTGPDMKNHFVQQKAHWRMDLSLASLFTFSLHYCIKQN